MFKFKLNSFTFKTLMYVFIILAFIAGIFVHKGFAEKDPLLDCELICLAKDRDSGECISWQLVCPGD